MEKNKIVDCYRSKSKEKRSDCLEMLAYEIENSKAKMNDEEWEELISKFKEEESEYVLYSLWSVAICAGPYNKMEEFCKEYIWNDKYKKRNMAITYLGRFYPANKEKLLKDLGNSKDANILFSLAMLLDKKDVQKKMELVLKAYGFVDPFDHSLHEGLEYVLTENGTEEHLEYFNNILRNHPGLKEKYKIPMSILKDKLNR